MVAVDGLVPIDHQGIYKHNYDPGCSVHLMILQANVGLVFC